MSTGRLPMLGIIQLDCGQATEESSAEIVDRRAVTPFWIEDPSFWKLPFQTAIARGATPLANKVPTREAAKGILDAAVRLDGRVQLIIGNCGYMWASREHLYGRTSTPSITSGLEFLSLALKMTSQPVGIITWNADSLVPLVQDVPGWERLRYVSMSDLPEWAKSWTCWSAYETPHGWTKHRMAKELADRLNAAFATEGVFADVAILVIECTLVPDFRKTIRAITPLPILDLIQFAKTALE